MMRHAADRATHHGTNEEARTEDAASVSRGVADSSGHDLQYRQQNYDLEYQVAVEHLFHIVVPDSHHLGHKVTHHSYGQSADNWLQPNAPLGKTQEPCAKPEQQLHETDRTEAAYDAEYRVNAQLRWMDEAITGDMK